MKQPADTKSLTTAERYNALASHKAGYRRGALHAGDADAIKAIIETALRKDRPVPVMIYWAKGVRDEVTDIEKEGIAFVKKALSQLDMPVDLHVVFADTHVAFNGIDLPESYIEQTRAAFDEIINTDDSKVRFSGLSRLSDYVNPDIAYTSREGGYDALRKHTEQSKQCNTEMLDVLGMRAEKYYQRDDTSPQDVARMYYELCKSEKEPVGRAFPDTIFLTYNSSKQHDFSVPSGMPAFNMYAFDGHISDKPWNRPDTKTTEREHQQRIGMPRGCAEGVC